MRGRSGWEDLSGQDEMGWAGLNGQVWVGRFTAQIPANGVSTCVILPAYYSACTHVCFSHFHDTG